MILSLHSWFVYGMLSIQVDFHQLNVTQFWIFVLTFYNCSWVTSSIILEQLKEIPLEGKKQFPGFGHE